MDGNQFTKAAPGTLVSGIPLHAAEAGTLCLRPQRPPTKHRAHDRPVQPHQPGGKCAGRLQGTALALPDPKILIRSFVRREAQLSSYIENTYARYDDVAAAAAANQQDDRQPTASNEVVETLNAERAIDVGVESVFTNGRPISNNLLRQMHAVLLRGVRGEECPAASDRNRSTSATSTAASASTGSCRPRRTSSTT